MGKVLAAIYPLGQRSVRCMRTRHLIVCLFVDLFVDFIFFPSGTAEMVPKGHSAYMLRSARCGKMVLACSGWRRITQDAMAVTTVAALCLVVLVTGSNY